jgi:hypothetical protein
MLAGVPGEELKCPPELIEVTDAGVPLICALAVGDTKINPLRTRARAATGAEFSRFTYESYPSLETMAHPQNKNPAYYIRGIASPIGLSLFCQLSPLSG